MSLNVERLCRIFTPLNGLPLLLLRIYLAPILILAGYGKLQLGVEGVGLFQKLLPHPDIVAWFGNPDWGLGLPYPELLAWLATWTEVGGAVLLALGLAVRWVSIPLMITMLVAMFKVHWVNGWLAVATGSGVFATERTVEAVERLDRAKDILREHGNYSWLTEHGNFVVLNNGIEFGATYFIMLLVLFFMGGGRWFALDHWIARRFRWTH